MIRFYDASDYPTLCEWWRGHGVEVQAQDELPSIGVVVPDVAACFLYRTDSTTGFVEHMVSNPRANPFAIAAAIRSIVKEITDLAAATGIKQLRAITQFGILSDYGSIGSGAKLEERTFTVVSGRLQDGRAESKQDPG